ncbi:hypothetical protein [Neobacillus dielmonensis]|uniref:hypothetical protein n=1 Tax=Neobacillus dielmonensis TaxID=1347369 RepID=UPI0005A7C8B7|nr:hypothetical protein [Neobacillus dielmonensis]
MEKEVWKWVLENFSDEAIANIGHNLGIKVPGFRQINHQQKKFKLLRPKLIQEAVHPKNSAMLKDFFNKIAEGADGLAEWRDKSTDELLESIGVEIPPSMLFSVLMSSEIEEDIKRGQEIFIKLKEEEKLTILERQAEEKREEAEKNSEQEYEQLKQLQEEVHQFQQKISNLEKKVKKSERKNEDLKEKATVAQVGFEQEKKQWREEKKSLSQEMQALKEEYGKVKNKLADVAPELETLKNKMDHQAVLLKRKDDEIARLNALLLKLKTEQDRPIKEKNNDYEQQQLATSSEQEAIPVAVIGDPMNTRVQKYKRYDLTIIEASEIHDERTNETLQQVEQIWLLTYKTPRGIQKRVKSLVKEKPIQEFATFIDLENYMMKG